MDRLLPLAAAGRCLVYSFGVGKDASFENAMADLGCRQTLLAAVFDRI